MQNARWYKTKVSNKINHMFEYIFFSVLPLYTCLNIDVLYLHLHMARKSLGLKRMQRIFILKKFY